MIKVAHSSNDDENKYRKYEYNNKIYFNINYRISAADVYNDNRAQKLDQDYDLLVMWKYVIN